MRTVCFTSLTYGYLSRARILAETLRAAHPHWPLWAVMVDEPPDGCELSAPLASGFDGVVPASELGIPRFRAWMFKHAVVEACTAVKGAALCHFLRSGAERVVYFDPDIALFHPLEALDGRHRHASVVLTPHQLDANRTPVAMADNELAALRYGVFNLGFLSVRNDNSGRAFAQWWAARLHDACYDDVARGLFTDQKYCDLAPALFDNVAIARERGWNVASWNLSQRPISFSDAGELLAAGDLLAFYHFTKFGGVGETMTDRYAGDRSEPRELWDWYGRRLAAHAEPGIPPGWWHYGRFSNGEPVPRAARLFYRARRDLMQAFDDPFDAGGDSLYAWLRAHAPEVFSCAAPPEAAWR